MAATPAPRIVQKVAAINRYLSEDFLGGPKWIKAAWVINLQKAGTLPFVLLLMWLYGNYSTAAWVYLGLHGSYGLIWLLKHLAFRDPNWEKRITLGGAVMAWLMVLGPYWIAPFLLISGVLGERTWPSSALLGLCILIYVLGVVLMVVSDAQKYFTLRVKRGLITDGMFRYVRHPNYLGEMLLYGSFALLVGHWLPWLVLGIVWSQVFLTNMLMKEASMSRYPEWAAYKARTGMLLPKLSSPSRGALEGSGASPGAPGGG
jgi:protein-S-isoprenylcysteine O-methyltransferase Ste14